MAIPGAQFESLFLQGLPFLVARMQARSPDFGQSKWEIQTDKFGKHQSLDKKLKGGLTVMWSVIYLQPRLFYSIHLLRKTQYSNRFGINAPLQGILTLLKTLYL